MLVVKGEALLVRRPDKGLLGGMLALPTGDWGEGDFPQTPSPAEAAWEEVGEVRHVFTHFAFRFRVMRAEASRKPKVADGRWVKLDEVEGLPSVFAKAFRLAVA